MSDEKRIPQLSMLTSDGHHDIQQFSVLRRPRAVGLDDTPPKDYVTNYRYDLDISAVKKEFGCGNSENLAGHIYGKAAHMEYSIYPRFGATLNLLVGWKLYLAMVYDQSPAFSNANYLAYLLEKYNVVITPESELQLSLSHTDQIVAATQAMERYVLEKHDG